MSEPSAKDRRMRDLAAKLFWWKDPEEALADERRFLAQAMTYGSWEDMELVRLVYREGALRAVLANAPAGVFDRRSWDYWHLVLGNATAPALPRRRL